MNRLVLRFSLFIILLCTSFFSLEANAGVVIVSAPPPIREVIIPPSGYSACYTVRSHFVNGFWVPKHRVCEYGPVNQGNVWVSGYWQCTHYSPYDGICRYWVWNPAHWAVVNEYEYYRPWHVAYYQPAAYYHPVFYPAYYHRGWGPGGGGGWRHR